MLQTIASWIATGIVALLAWLLPKYVERRVTEAARGVVDVTVGKILVDYKLGVDKQLETYRAELIAKMEDLRQGLAFDRERHSRDYGLFATKRNELYAETFSLLEKARGGFRSKFAKLLSYRDFSRSSKMDLRDLAGKLELVSASERQQLKDTLDADNIEKARELAGVLNERDELRRANRSFFDLRNAVTLNALYYSPAVDTLLSLALQPLAVLSTMADEMIAGDDIKRREAYAHVSELDDVVNRLRSTMREEMQAGFKPGQIGRNVDSRDVQRTLNVINDG